MEIGERINRFVYLGVAPYVGKAKKPHKKGYFKCDCGLIKSFDYYPIRGGDVKMCVKCAAIERGKKKATHRLIKHPLYRKWQDMKNRCYNKNVDRYSSYGGNGICVCDEWRYNFKSFYDWCLKNGWERGLTIDRKDVYGNYEPSNCRFISMKEQGFNKKNTLYIEYNGHKISLAKLMYVNGKSDKYRNAWFLIKKKDKSPEFVINKYNLDISLIKEY
jgi:hypothetical protein